MTTTDTLMGIQLDEYRLEKMLGRGGMARVYRAVDTRLNRYVAIKVIDTPFRQNSSHIERFKHEAQAIAQLHHPNIVTLYRYNDVDGLLYMAMQYVEGVDLGKIIADTDENSRIPLPEVLSIMRQLCSALDYAHEKGVIHRDVKPSNIMVESNGHVFLTDFGLALSPDVSRSGEVFGSPHYISPEQVISQDRVVPQSDYYAVGVMLYEMLTGRLPFESDSPIELAGKHLSETPPSLLQFRPDLNPLIEAVVMKLLEKEAKDRFQNGKELVAALETAISSSPEVVATRPNQSLSSRVSAEIQNNPLPPIQAPVVPPPFGHSPIVPPPPDSPPPRTSSFSDHPFMPTLFVAGGVLAILLCLGTLLVTILNLGGDDDDEPSAAQQPIAVTLTASPSITPSVTVAITSTATTALQPTPTPLAIFPTSPPPPLAIPPTVAQPNTGGGFAPLQNGIGLTTGQAMNNGDFQVEGYCQGGYIEGYPAVTHDDNNWYCLRREGSDDGVRLRQADFDRICQLTYSNPSAVAVQTEGGSIPAFSWKCFGPT